MYATDIELTFGVVVAEQSQTVSLILEAASHLEYNISGLSILAVVESKWTSLPEWSVPTAHGSPR